MDMKKTGLCITLAVCCVLGLHAQVSPVSERQVISEDEVTVSGVKVAENDSTLFVSMDIDVSRTHLRSNREAVFTPIVISAEEEAWAELPAVRVVGRSRWFRYQRNCRDELVLRRIYRQGRHRIIHYNAAVPFENWMGQSALYLRDSRCGCMKKLFSKNESLLARMDLLPKVIIEKKFIPHYLYERPVVAEKLSEVSGSAYIDYPVSRTAINPAYRNNRVELDKILSTIDRLKNDSYVEEIRSLTFKGYASPEGPYEGNARLAEGRVKSLIAYVERLYAFPHAKMHSEFEPEDWAGLRRYVEASDLPHRRQILDLIDRDDLRPDSREWLLKSTYKEEYRRLLTECYPGLRHSDYTIEYTLRKITDIEEAKRLVRERPAVLSLEEFYRVANCYEEGSEAYDEAFDVMVRIYPHDAIANLNAANVAMSRGDFVSAAKFLGKAGKTAKAVYAKGVCAALQRDFPEARTCFEAALEAGIVEAEAALEQVEEIEEGTME